MTAAHSPALKVSMAEALRLSTLRVEVTGKRRAAIRIRIGVRLLALAAFVIGCGIEVSMKGDEAPDPAPAEVV